MPDIYIDGRGFYTITGATEAGKDWLRDNVQGYMPLQGIAYCDNGRYAEDIADGAADDGLSVAVNGREYAAV